ncbi:VOC family protein [Nocardia cyriacigeorgica]|jgi:predicted enzyme related to lactoylglutathione lyase|uniref:VOC family protein n=1 Tax=Nocardia cyriacigeorgica TaxID=135487 RepID=UPI00056CB8C0|nr:VOC family protein [Nocardia cyriacigeorgica]AVH22562.1 glyoxalase/bleomycin resistance/dioxygenase family protein [Nocardia cyriacigeorgica]MBF6086777.1 VOC family protein [Nocardia cyriacigeorgica]MBF6090910.1 VOC family protein [Nocardia cyriacigeorgica]MBF6100691.1 VOC family protein [Nocardia cyriacigeorgica]MBF6318881.1 VOC family protein [Nocardia cyriacigeorgica]
MTTRLACVVFDADQPRMVADFWARLLGWTVTLDRPGEVDVAGPDAAGSDLALTFIPASRAKTGKNRIHLDVASRSTDHQRMQVDRAMALGARAVDIGQGAVPWTVLADPEGNEFCVLEPREEYVDTGAVAAIVVDTFDPQRLAQFWSVASGWPISRAGSPVTGLRSPTGLGSWLEFVETSEAKQGRNRLRLDVAAFPADDPTAEVARLRAAGARTIEPSGAEPGLPLADPETNEFYLLAPDYDGSAL